MVLITFFWVLVGCLSHPRMGAPWKTISCSCSLAREAFIGIAVVNADPVAIARDLIRCRSVTPEEGGALAYLQRVLAEAGFAVHRATFAEPGTAPVENLYARIGDASAQSGVRRAYRRRAAGRRGGMAASAVRRRDRRRQLYGRGAVDMKGGIACFVAAALDHLAANGGKPKKARSRS